MAQTHTGCVVASSFKLERFCLGLTPLVGLEVRIRPDHVLVPVVGIDYVPHAGQVSLRLK